VSFVAITLCVASQRVIPKVSVYFVIDSVRKLLDTHLHVNLFYSFNSSKTLTERVSMAVTFRIAA
jgi:hypothetical protein